MKRALLYFGLLPRIRTLFDVKSFKAKVSDMYTTAAWVLSKIFFLTYRFLFLPELHCRFVLFKLVTPIGVNFLIVVAFLRGSASGEIRDKILWLSHSLTLVFYLTLQFRMTLTYEHQPLWHNYIAMSHPNDNHKVRHQFHVLPQSLIPFQSFRCVCVRCI